MILSLVVTLLVALNASVDGGNPDAKRLYDDLLSDYNKLVRPVVNVSEAVTVRLKLKLSQLIDVNLKNQIMTTNLWVEQYWYDHKLQWDPLEYGGVDMLHVPSDHIWRPDIVLYNNADGNFEVTLATKATLMASGKVEWKPPAIYHSSCEMDVEYFPFDEQTCVMKFGSWTYDGFQVDLRHIDEVFGQAEVEVGVDLTEFYMSVEWDILEVPAIRNVKYYTCCDEPYLDITFNVTMRRKTLFYTVNLIIPCMGISFLTVLVFYLPSDSGEKVSLSISILLSLTVFFLLLAEIIPPTSLVVPLLGKFVLFTMILDTFSICVTVVVLNVHFRTPQTHTMAPWVRRVFIHILPRLLVMRRPHYDLDKHRYDEMKHPSYTFLTADNMFATAETIDPQLLTESIKSFKSQARDIAEAVRRNRRKSKRRHREWRKYQQQQSSMNSSGGIQLRDQHLREYGSRSLNNVNSAASQSQMNHVQNKNQRVLVRTCNGLELRDSPYGQKSSILPAPPPPPNGGIHHQFRSNTGSSRAAAFRSSSSRLNSSQQNGGSFVGDNVSASGVDILGRDMGEADSDITPQVDPLQQQHQRSKSSMSRRSHKSMKADFQSGLYDLPEPPGSGMQRDRDGCRVHGHSNLHVNMDDDCDDDGLGGLDLDLDDDLDDEIDEEEGLLDGRHSGDRDLDRLRGFHSKRGTGGLFIQPDRYRGYVRSKDGLHAGARRRRRRFEAADDFAEYLFSPTVNATARDLLCPEVSKALSGVMLIAEQKKRLEESTKVIEDWKYVAMVLDRLFLWIFTVAVLVGTAGIILQAPTLYDDREPLDIKLSEIGLATARPMAGVNKYQ